MKRFYKIAEVGTAPGGFVIRLDGRTLKTPLQHPLILPDEAFARALAAEWQAQGDEVIPASMPLNQLVNTLIDKAQGADRAAMEEEVLRYTGSDLVCYFATHPADLVARQEAAWRPLLDWLRDALGIVLEAVSGIQYHHQPQPALDAFAQLVRRMSAPQFTFMQAATALFGSPVMALALLHGKMDADQAFQAAAVDEIYQLEKWGEDTLARRKLDHLRREIEALVTFRDFIKASA